MRKSQQLRQERDEHIKVAQNIMESATAENPLSDEQRALFDSTMAKADVLKADIDRHEKLEVLAINGPAPIDTRRPKPAVVENSGVVVTAPRMRHGKLRAFKGENAEENAYASGQWVLATMFGHENAQKWCASHGIPMHRNAASESDNTKGGFLVPDVMERTIIDLREEYGVFRQIARIHPMSSDYQTIPRRAGGLTAYAIGEGSDITDSTKLWNQIALTARKWAVMAKYTTEVAEDAIINVAEDLSQEIAYAFALAEDTAGFTGDGTSTYHGIRGVTTKFEAVIGTGQLAGAVDAATNHDTFLEIDATDLTTAMAKLPKYALNRASWICSQPCWALVFQRLLAAAGGNSAMDLNGKMAPSYLGYPVVISQLCPTSTGDLSDKVMLYFGDAYSAISMGSRRGISLAVSSERYFESDQIAIRGTERFDINVHDIGDATTAGPLVALIGE